MSKYIVKAMNLEMPKRLIIWDGGSSIQCMYDKIIGHYEMLLEMVK